MSAFRYDLKIDQYTTYETTITWKAGATLGDTTSGTAVDLTGCTARMHVKSKVTDLLPLVELTTENGGLLLGGTAGTIKIVFTETNTTVDWLLAVYDLVIEYPSGKSRRLVQGTITINPGVTRE